MLSKCIKYFNFWKALDYVAYDLEAFQIVKSFINLVTFHVDLLCEFIFQMIYVIFDPMVSEKSGVAAVRQHEDKSEIYTA